MLCMRFCLDQVRMNFNDPMKWIFTLAITDDEFDAARKHALHVYCDGIFNVGGGGMRQTAGRGP